MNGARIRTLIVAAGLGFAATALGSACLDYAGEDWGTCAATAKLGAGSGSGTGAPAPTADCGVDAPRPDPGGSGSGSAR